MQSVVKKEVTKTRPAGLEPATYGLEILSHQNTSAKDKSTYESTESKLTPQLTPDSRKENGDDIQKMPDDLAEIIGVWPQLPKHIKLAIKALVEAGRDS
ncbi:hypothetical protein ACFL5Z_19250 [Planctomycetota bacterium]